MPVFHTEETVKNISAFFEDKYTDGRRLMEITDKDDLCAKQDDLTKVIKEWVK